MWSTLCPSTGSAIPCSRSKLAVCIHDGHVYMLGGRNGNVPVRDFWKYNISEHTWSEISCKGDAPFNVQDHTIVGWKGKLYVFGGEVGFASTGETPLWCYHIATNTWKKLSRGDATRPQGCRGHTAVVFDNFMFIYGGYRDLKGSISDLWCFDMEKESWRHLKSNGNGEIPSGRHDHSVIVYDGAMWVYGGMTDLQAKGDFWRWDFCGRQWNRVRCKGGPGELHGHSACKVLTSMVVFGGERGGQLLQEIWRYYFSLEMWEKVNVNGAKPSPRSRHLAIVVPTLFLLLPHSFDVDSSDSSSQNKQRRFQELVSKGSYAPSFSPKDSGWDSESKVTTSRMPKSETNCNFRQSTSFSNKSTGSGNSFGNTKKVLISTSFSQNNFKFLRERISTTSLFKPPAFNAATYVALSNSSDSVQSGQEEVPTDNVRATLRPLLLDSTNNKRFYGKNGMLSVPNFLKIHQLERRGLMDDLSDSSSVDISIGTNTTPKKLCAGNDTVNALRSNLRKRDQDSLENIPDIKDFISPDVADKQFQEDTVSVKLIDFEDNCNAGGASCSLPATPMNSQPLPKSLSYIERPLAAVNENLYDKHKVYANCLSRTSPITPDGNYRWPTSLEMKTFHRLPDFDEGISEDMFPSPDEREEDGEEDEEAEIMNEPIQVVAPKGCEELKPQMNNQSRHFSMLVLGGREQGFNGCGRRPIIMWKLDFWK